MWTCFQEDISSVKWARVVHGACIWAVWLMIHCLQGREEGEDMTTKQLINVFLLWLLFRIFAAKTLLGVYFAGIAWDAGTDWTSRETWQPWWERNSRSRWQARRTRTSRATGTARASRGPRRQRFHSKWIQLSRTENPRYAVIARCKKILSNK